MKHPDIMLGTSAAASLERIFAEEAFRLLGSIAIPQPTRMDGYYVTTATTDPIEMLTQGELEVAFRLNSMATFEGMEYAAFKPSNKYMAILMEYGELHDDDVDMDFVTAEDFTWHNYVLAVINTQNIDDVSVLDATTGKALAGDDLARAHFNLQEASNAIREAIYEEEVQDSMVAPMVTQLDKGYAEFKHQEYFVEPDHCRDHGVIQEPCEYSPFTPN